MLYSLKENSYIPTYVVTIRDPKGKYNLPSHFRWILLSMWWRFVNMMSTLKVGLTFESTTGSRLNFRLQKWKMADKNNTNLTLLLFWNCSCFLSIVSLVGLKFKSQESLQYFHFSFVYAAQCSQKFFVEKYESWAKKLRKLRAKKPKITGKIQAF